MSKKGTYNGPFFSHFATRLHGTPIRFGTLVATQAEAGQRDVVFAAPTPPEPGSEPGAVKDLITHLKSKAGAGFAAWSSQHSLALRKLLPGGLEPCGCFAIVSEADAKDLAPLLTPAMKGIEDALVLTIDPSSRKLTFWSYSGGAKPALRPAQVKSDSHKDALFLYASVPMDLALPRSDVNNEDTEACASAVERAVDRLLSKSICGAAAEDAKTPMRVVDLASEQPVSAMAPKGCDELRVTFLHGGTCLTVPAESGTCLRQRTLVMASVVVLRRDVEMRKAVELLRKEVAASAAERLRIAREEATAAAEEAVADDTTQSTAAGVPPLLHLPWRAVWRPQETELPLWCGDYCMPDEDAPAARERLGQLLGLPEDAFEEAPNWLDEHARIKQNHAGTYEAPSVDEPDSPKAGGGKAPKPAIACVVAVIVVMAAALVPMVLKT